MTFALPTVSACITTYNSSSTLRETLTSVLGQTHAPEEIFVTDDASSDDTVRIARAVGGDRVHVLQEVRNNGGPAWGRNAALAAASSDFVAFLDGDDVWREDKLAVQVQALHSSGARACCSAAMAVGGGASYDYPVGLRDSDHRIGFAQLVLLNHVVASSAVVDRALLLEVGGFPERAECIGFEDYCAWMKLAAYSPWHFVAEPLVRYSVGVPSLRTTTRSQQADIRIECRRELVRQAQNLPSLRSVWAVAAFVAASSASGHLSALRYPRGAR